MLDIEEKISWLRLLRTPKIGRVTFFHLLKQFKSAQCAIDGLDEYILSLSSKRVKYVVTSKESILKFLDECKKSNVKLIFSCDKDYPKEFLLAHDYPPVLFCKGNTKLLNQDCIAVIGSRSASLQGISFTKKIVKDLNGLCIISGFAKGIDTAAHEASLTTGTIAVLGAGVNHIYPEENTALYNKILENNGLIISEIGLNDTPRPNFFAYRNRLISGISKGILVVEAAMNSGSLITAKYAVEQGKTIFAVPGHPYDLRSFGTNYLIKNGAVLVRNADDILSEYYSYSSIINKEKNQASLFEVQEDNIDDVKNWILENISLSSISISEIIFLSKYSVGIVNAALAELQLLDFIDINQDLVTKK